MAVDITSRVTSNNNVWSPLVSGSAAKTGHVFHLSALNQNAVGARISARVRKGATNNALIIPGDLLPSDIGRNSTRPRIPLLYLEPADFLEVSSDIPVSWQAQYQNLDTLKPYSRIATLSGDTWTDLTANVGRISAIWIANTSMGNARVSARIMSGSTVILNLFDQEDVPEGASRRLLSPTVLATGHKLQLKSVGGIDVIVTGVSN